MSTYTKTTNFTAKDNLTSGDPAKVIKGSEFDTEFNSIETAVNSKANANNTVLTGTTTVDTADINTLQIDGSTVTATPAELNTLDGITSTTAELNTLDGFTGTVDDLNYAKDLRASGVTSAEFDKIDGLTADSTELNILDGATVTTAELNILDGVTATALEINTLDGITASTAELNVTDGLTATTAELNTLDGITSSTAELNILDGVTASTTEINYVDGVTSGIQGQLDGKADSVHTHVKADITDFSDADYATAAQGALADSALQPSDPLDAVDSITITSTDADGDLDPALNIYRNSSTPVNNDLLGVVKFTGRNDNAEDFEYGTIYTSVVDVADGSEDGKMHFGVGVAGVPQSVKMTVDSTGIDVSGLSISGTAVTSTAAELNVLDGITATTTELNYTDGVTSSIQTQLDGKATTAQGALADSAVQPNDNVSFGTGDFSGDVDVTGTVTADGLTVDGAGSISGNFGVGTTSPARKSHIISPSTVPTLIESTSTASYITLMDSTTTDNLRVRIGSIGDNLITYAGGSERMRIDSSGNVGIGTASPTGKLDVVGGRLYIDSTDDYAIRFEKNSVVGGYIGAPSSSVMAFYNSAGAEKARIDSSGNLLVGKTALDSATDGVQLVPDGISAIARSSGEALRLTRNDNDGEILRFQKDGTTVGSIGTNGDDLLISNGNVGLRFFDSSNAIIPRTSAGTTSDGLIDLGLDVHKFKNLYLSGVVRADTIRANKAIPVTSGDTSTGHSFTSVLANSSSAGATWRKVADITFNASAFAAMTIEVETLVAYDNYGSAAGWDRVEYVVGVAYSTGALGSPDNATITGGVGVNQLRVQKTSSGVFELQCRPNANNKTMQVKCRVVQNENGIITPTASWSTGSTTGTSYVPSTTGGQNLYTGSLILNDGVYLGGTGSANKLDDYEEGTWTPELGGYTGTTYTGQSGVYTKVGRLVTVHFVLTISNVGTYAGNSRIVGLPFPGTGYYNTNGVGAQPTVMTGVNTTRDEHFIAVYNGGSDMFVYSKTNAALNGNNYQAGVISGTVSYLTNS